MAVVTEDGVSARVGSRFSGLREVVQVRLQKGEVVEIIEAPARGAGEGGWFKIAPPSGEFRWVSAKYLDTNDPQEGVRKATPGDRHNQKASKTGRGWDGESSLNRSPGPRSLTPAQFQAELERIELELSAMVIEEPAAWSFDSLRERTDQLLEVAQTAVERGRARLLANRIARFDDIKQRQDALLAMRSDSLRNGRAAENLSGVDGPRLRVNPDVDGRFDGVGQLTQVVSPKVAPGVTP